MQLGFVLTGRRINSAKFRLTPVRSLKDIIGPGNFDNETEICESRKFCLFAAARETEIFLRPGWGGREQDSPLLLPIGGRPEADVPVDRNVVTCAVGCMRAEGKRDVTRNQEDVVVSFVHELIISQRRINN